MLEVIIGVLVMEVDNVVDKVTSKLTNLTNMMTKIPTEDFSDTDM